MENPKASPVEIDYTNHRGLRGVRLILPTGRMLPGDPVWHPGAPWVIEAVDCAKAALRTFDPAHIHRWTPKPAGSPIFAHETQVRAEGARSVLQDWVMDLSTRQQGVLILALRGPDGSPKESAAKPIVRTLRALVMVSGRERKPMDFSVAWRDDTFMNTVHISQDGSWLAVMDAFFAEMDACNLHFFQHLIHAYAVVGLHFPVESIRNRCWGFYLIACRMLHVHPETPEQILHRLRDGLRAEDTPDDLRERL